MAVTGKEGLVQYKGEAVDELNNFSADVAVDIRDHTAFTTGSVFFRTTKPGLAGLTATVAGFYAVGSTDQDDMIEATLAGSTGNMDFIMDKGTGGAINSSGTFFNSMNLSAAVDGDVTISFGVTSNGAVAYTTTT